MDQSRWRRGRWLAGGPLIAVFFAGVAYSQTVGGQAPAGTTSPTATPATKASSPDDVVLRVGDKSITRGEVDKFIQGLTPQAKNSLASQGRRPLGDEYVKMLVLSQEALSQHLDSTPAFKEMLALHRLEVLAALESQKISAVTSEEASKYYASHQADFEQIQIMQVVVRKKPQGAKEGTPGFTPEEAKARAEEIRKAFVAGDDPKKIAEKYQVENLVRVDSQPYPIQRGAMRPDMEKAAFALRPGQVTDVFDFGQALAFVDVVSRSTSDFKAVSTQIESTLQRQKFDEAFEALKKNAKVWMDETYFAGSSQTAPRVSIKPQGTVTIPLNPK